MNILVLGGGGREYAIAKKLSESVKSDRIFLTPGNGGTAEFTINLDISPMDSDALLKIVEEYNIELTIVGPEDPLAQGIADKFRGKGKLIVGPDQLAAQLEASKSFAKQFMEKYNIPTAKYAEFSSESYEKALKFVRESQFPIVIKADGLAAGKGVVICENQADAEEVIQSFLQNQKFGEASEKIIIEEFLDGIETSAFVLTDGKNFKLLPFAKDYKRIFDGDKGANTGGMGTVSPVPFVDAELRKKIIEKVVKPTIKGIQAEKYDYRGFVFIGLMIVNNEPFVLEYNVRLGDPETQVILPRIEDDFVELMMQTAEQKLTNTPVKISNEHAVCVIAVSGGYPESYQKGFGIKLDKLSENVSLVHAGTKKNDEELVTSGGRVLAIVAKSGDLESTVNLAYENMGKIKFEGIFYRKDIGQDLLKLV